MLASWQRDSPWIFQTSLSGSTFYGRLAFLTEESPASQSGRDPGGRGQPRFQKGR